MTPDADIAAKIQATVTGLTVGTNLFVGKLRALDEGTPAKCVFCLSGRFEIVRAA